MPMMPEIKICGIQHLEEAAFINALKVDYVGFVFAKSKRRVTPQKARELSLNLRPGILRVGVFAGQTLDEVLAIQKECRLDIVQLHGGFNDAEMARLQCPVWRAVAVEDESSTHELAAYKIPKAFVLDASVKGMSGGTGKSFNWEWARHLSSEHRIVLAGGLTPDNVIQAIATVQPHVVDVSSGVEGTGGKDEKLVRKFIETVRGNAYE